MVKKKHKKANGVPEEQVKRNKEIWRKSEKQGYSCSVLAKEYDLTAPRIFQIIKRQKEKLESS